MQIGLRRRAAHDNLQDVIGQRPLQRLGLVPRRAHPDVAFCLIGQDHRHRLRIAPEPNPETKKKDVVWFALDDSRPLFCFAGIWTEFKGDRGTKSKPIPGPHLVDGFLTTSPVRACRRAILPSSTHPSRIPKNCSRQSTREQPPGYRHRKRRSPGRRLPPAHRPVRSAERPRTWPYSRLTVDGLCSYFVLMESSHHFKPPWTLVRENSECYVVKDANGVTLAWLYCRDDAQRYSFGVSKLSSDEARRIGKAIARIPEFLMQRQGFYPRGGGPRWRADRPYHVALEDRYIREHWGRNRRSLQTQQPAVQRNRGGHRERRRLESL